MKKVLNVMVILLIVVLAIFLLDSKATNANAKVTVETQPTYETIVSYEEETQETIISTSIQLNDVVDATEETVEEQPIETEPCVFDENIVFELEYVNDGEVIPYALLKPTSVDENIPMPLIVWLHGSGERNVYEETFLKVLPTDAMLNWDLLNFNAYVICPQLKNKFNTQAWCNESAKYNLTQLLDRFIETHNIDQDKIIIAGTSLGGQGAIYLSVKMADYFDKAVIFNGYPCSVTCAEIEIPVIGYVGTLAKGEEPMTIDYMNYNFAYYVGKEYLHVIETSHGALPKVVFCLDEDGNGKSDIIEWMLLDPEEGNGKHDFIEWIHLESNE